MTRLREPAAYDSLGQSYRHSRAPDRRIARQIEAALGNAERVCNVGAGTGSYEPFDRKVVAVEPSNTMIAQRRGSVAVRAIAEALPFGDDSFDAAMAVLTIHHWSEALVGLKEMSRIAPRRVVLTFDPTCQDLLWLVRDYVPGVVKIDQGTLPIEAVAEAIGADRVESVLVPWDCTDGFLAAYWRRPEFYLDPAVRAGISGLALLPASEVEAGMEELADDLASGRWAARNSDLLARTEMDYGYRLIVSGSLR